MPSAAVGNIKLGWMFWDDNYITTLQLRFQLSLYHTAPPPQFICCGSRKEERKKERIAKKGELVWYPLQKFWRHLSASFLL